jgi:hypothetical protein
MDGAETNAQFRSVFFATIPRLNESNGFATVEEQDMPSPSELEQGVKSIFLWYGYVFITGLCNNIQ